MKKNKTFLSCYHDWMKKGKLPYWGLCDSFDDVLSDEESLIWFMMAPTAKDIKQLRKEGKSPAFWGTETPYAERNPKVAYGYEFNPLRQTLVLLAACLNNEL